MYLRYYYLALIGVGLCWATTPLWVVTAGWDPLGTVLVRALLTGLALQTMWTFQQRSLSRTPQWGLMVLSGAAAALSTSCFAAAFLLTEPGKVYVLYYLFPLLLLGWESGCAKRYPRPVEAGALALALLGLTLIFGKATHIREFGAGELAALASAFFWAVHIVTARKLSSDSDVVLGNSIGQFLVVGVLAYPVLTQVSVPSVYQSVSLAALGFFSFAALALWGIGVRRVPGHVAGIITMLEAPGGVVLMCLFFQVPLSFVMVLGGLMVLVAALITIASRKPALEA